MGDNVVSFGGGTLLPVPVDNVLNGAIEADLLDVVVVGRERDGGVYIASSIGSREVGETVFLMECAKHILLQSSLDCIENTQRGA